MKLSEHWESYATYTADFSSASRTAAFGGIAVCWLLMNQQLLLARPLAALALFVSFLAIDILQLFISSLLYRGWLRNRERHLQASGDPLIDQAIDKPSTLDLPAFVLFLLKTAFLFAGFVLIGIEAWSRVIT